MAINKMIIYLILVIAGIYLAKEYAQPFIIGGLDTVSRQSIINKESDFYIPGTYEVNNIKCMYIDPTPPYENDIFTVRYTPSDVNFVWAFDEWLESWLSPWGRSSYTFTVTSPSIIGGSCGIEGTTPQDTHLRCYSASPLEQGYGQTANYADTDFTVPAGPLPNILTDTDCDNLYSGQPECDADKDCKWVVGICQRDPDLTDLCRNYPWSYDPNGALTERSVTCHSDACNLGPNTDNQLKITFDSRSTFLVDDYDGTLTQNSMVFAECVPTEEKCDAWDRNCNYMAGVDEGQGRCGYDVNQDLEITPDDYSNPATICKIGTQPCDPEDILCQYVDTEGPNQWRTCYFDSCSGTVLPNGCNPETNLYGICIDNINGAPTSTECVDDTDCSGGYICDKSRGGRYHCQSTPIEICENNLDDDCDGSLADDTFPFCKGCITWDVFIEYATDWVSQKCVKGYCSAGSDNPGAPCNIDGNCPNGVCEATGLCTDEGGMIAQKVPLWTATDPDFGFREVAVWWVTSYLCEDLYNTLIRVESRGLETGTSIAYVNICGNVLAKYGFDGDVRYRINTGLCQNFNSPVVLPGGPQGELYLYKQEPTDPINTFNTQPQIVYLRYWSPYVYACENDDDGDGFYFRRWALNSYAGYCYDTHGINQAACEDDLDANGYNICKWDSAKGRCSIILDSKNKPHYYDKEVWCS